MENTKSTLVMREGKLHVSLVTEYVIGNPGPVALALVKNQPVEIGTEQAKELVASYVAKAQREARIAGRSVTKRVLTPAGTLSKRLGRNKNRALAGSLRKFGIAAVTMRKNGRIEMVGKRLIAGSIPVGIPAPDIAAAKENVQRTLTDTLADLSGQLLTMRAGQQAVVVAASTGPLVRILPQPFYPTRGKPENFQKA